MVGPWLAGTGVVGAACGYGGQTARQKSTLYVWRISMGQRQRGQRAIVGAGVSLGTIVRTEPLRCSPGIYVISYSIRRRSTQKRRTTMQPPNVGCELLMAEIWPRANWSHLG